jgi:hypothetical protein
MAQVDVVWRILLFMGFGAAFLGLSYLINRAAPGPNPVGGASGQSSLDA